MHQTITLPNGVRILTDKIPGVRTAALGIFVGTGSRHEKAGESGAAHFIEHMTFKGTARRTAQQLAMEMDELGGQVNAYTTKESTCFYLRCLDRHLARGMDLLCDMFFSSRFAQEDLVTERGVILEEIDMYEDTPEDLCSERLAAAVYRGSALARPILGRRGTLEKMEQAGGKRTAEKNVTVSKKLSLKTMTLNNEKQKVNDLLGNPVIIGIAVIWRVENTAKAVFHVDNFQEFLSIQCDAALRNIVRLYPYDVSEEGDEKSLRGSSQEIAVMLQEEIQRRVTDAGLHIEEARITHLAYAPEIAAVMLQRQQAAAIIDARKMIVEGAVSMVEQALKQLSESHIVELDAERRAQMVSNLLVVLCGNKDAQPVVNSGSIY